VLKNTRTTINQCGLAAFNHGCGALHATAFCIIVMIQWGGDDRKQPGGYIGINSTLW